MGMKIPAAIKKACDTFSRQYVALEEYFDDYIMDNESTLKLVKSFIDSLIELVSDAEAYVEALATQYADALILTNPKAISRIRSANVDTLSSELLDTLTAWEENPGFFCFFTIQERICKDFFAIEDCITGNTYKLYSPSLQDLQEKHESRNVHYLALMMNNGECLQASGTLHYTHYSSSDIDFLCNTFDATTFSSSGLTGLLLRHPTAMYYLDFQIPGNELVHNGHILAVFYISVPRLSYTFDPDYWTIDNRGKVASYSLERSSDAMHSAYPDETFWNDIAMAGMRVFKMEKHWIVLALYGQAFEALLTILGLSRDTEPVSVALSLVLHLQKHAKRLPWTPFFLLPEEGMHQESNQEMDMTALYTFFGNYSDAYNNGKPFDLVSEARKLGIDEDLAKDLIEQMQKKRESRDYQVPEAEVKYRLEGWPVPSPAERDVFGDGILSSELFLILDSDETDDAFNVLSGNQWKEEIEEMGLFFFLQDAFSEEFYDDGVTILNTFLWILLHLSEQKVLVRSIALEIFCLFPFLNDFYEFEDFVERFSEKVYKLFCRTSLCTITHRVKREERKRGLYTVQASSFLKSIISPIG